MLSVKINGKPIPFESFKKSRGVNWRASKVMMCLMAQEPTLKLLKTVLWHKKDKWGLFREVIALIRRLRGTGEGYNNFVLNVPHWLQQSMLSHKMHPLIPPFWDRSLDERGAQRVEGDIRESAPLKGPQPRSRLWIMHDTTCTFHHICSMSVDVVVLWHWHRWHLGTCLLRWWQTE